MLPRFSPQPLDRPTAGTTAHPTPTGECEGYGFSPAGDAFASHGSWRRRRPSRVPGDHRTLRRCQRTHDNGPSGPPGRAGPPGLAHVGYSTARVRDALGMTTPPASLMPLGRRSPACSASPSGMGSRRLLGVQANVAAAIAPVDAARSRTLACLIWGRPPSATGQATEAPSLPRESCEGSVLNAKTTAGGAHRPYWGHPPRRSAAQGRPPTRGIFKRAA
jgi:hypothetical protein